MEFDKWKYDGGSLSQDFNFDINKTIIGLPGTGKTTTLQQDILQSLKYEGYNFDEIAVGTFTNAMADEFQERARAEFPVAGKLDWFDTIHSLCSGLLRRNNIYRDEVIGTEEKEVFCKEFGIPFSATADYDKSSTADDEKGNALFDLRDYCLNMMKDPVEDWKWAYREVNPDPVVNQRMVQEFNEEYVKWKEENDYIDFVDMVKICVEENLTPPTSVLIEDEFQDKSLLELKLFEQWSNAAEKTFVAGDPFQAIYGFKGTNPDYMIEAYRQANQGIILDTTYRFGSNLWNFADSVLRMADYDVPEIECDGETEVEFLSWTQYMRKVGEHQSDDCFHLVRSRHMFEDVEDVLRNGGVIPRTDFNDDQTVPYEKYYETVLDVEEIADEVQGSIQGFGDRRLDTESVDYLLKMCPESVFSNNKNKIKKTIKTKNKTGTNFKMSDIFSRKEFVDLFTYDNPFKKLNETRFSDWHKHRKTLAEAHARDNDLSKHVSHDIGTIHKSKGKDADYVFLMNGSTKTIKRNGSRKSESRVFFVGATRAKKKLYVVDTQEKYKFRMR